MRATTQGHQMPKATGKVDASGMPRALGAKKKRRKKK
jgi:hypothetical protein